jgi:glycerophosphoryl diester phosphodiesterase
MKIISHRGRINNFKKEENCSISINNFINSKINMIEIDIQLTKDNQIILYHDDKIKIKNSMCFFCQNERINKIDSNYLINNYNIIFLKQALDMIKGKKEIYLDIKNNKLNKNQYRIFFDKLLKLLDDYVLKYECERSSIYLASFYPEYIDYIISLPFEYKKGIILCQDNIEYFNKKFNDTKIKSLDFISVDYNILDSIKLYFNKIIIFCYTINNIEDYGNLFYKKKYINGIVTDYPEYFYNMNYPDYFYNMK